MWKGLRTHGLGAAVLALVSVLPVPGQAKMDETPQSFSLDDKSEEKIQRKILPKIDTERLLAEDRAGDRRRPGPSRFAVPADVTYTLTNSGTWQAVAGGRLWRLRIQSPGAKSLNLGITRFDLPKGAKLWIHDPERKHVEGSLHVPPPHPPRWPVDPPDPRR